MTPIWIAIISALGGGTVIKLIEMFVLPKGTQIDYAAKLRDELRKDIDSLRKQIDHLQKDLDDWKKKYYDLLQRYSDLNSQYKDLLLKYTDLEGEVHQGDTNAK